MAKTTTAPQRAFERSSGAVETIKVSGPSQQRRDTTRGQLRPHSTLSPEPGRGRDAGGSDAAPDVGRPSGDGTVAPAAPRATAAPLWLARRFPVTFFERLKKTRGRRVEMTAAELFRRLRTPQRFDRLSLQPKTDGSGFVKPEGLGGWSPGTFREDRRADVQIEQLHAVALDFDGTLSFDGAYALFGDFAGFVHTSFNHADASPRVRIVVLTSRPVSAREYRRLWRRLAALTPAFHPDASARNPSRFWYLPAIPEGAEYRCALLDGEPLAVDLALADVPDDEPEAPRRAPDCGAVLPPLDERERRFRKYLLKAGPAVEDQGGWEKTNDCALFGVRGLALPSERVLALLRDWNQICRPRWDDDALRKKVEWAATIPSAVPFGYALPARPNAPAIASRGDAVDLIERIAAAVEAMPTAGRTADSDRAIMRALVNVARRIGSVVVAMSERCAAERAKLNRKTAGAALHRCAATGLLRRVNRRPGTKDPDTGTWELRSPEEWRLGPLRDWASPEGTLFLRIDTGPISQPPVEDSDADLFRRSYGGKRGLGPKPRSLLRLLLVHGSAIDGPQMAADLLGWPCRSTALRVQQALERDGLVAGWQLVTRERDELGRLIEAAEQRRGLAGATARQKADHERQREGRDAVRRNTAAAATLAIERRGGEATIEALASDLDLRFPVVRDALRWMRSQNRARSHRDGKLWLWSVVGDGEQRPSAAPDAKTYALRRALPRNADGEMNAPGFPPVGETRSPGEQEAARPERNGVRERAADEAAPGSGSMRAPLPGAKRNARRGRSATPRKSRGPASSSRTEGFEPWRCARCAGALDGSTAVGVCFACRMAGLPEELRALVFGETAEAEPERRSILDARRRVAEKEPGRAPGEVRSDALLLRASC